MSGISIPIEPSEEAISKDFIDEKTIKPGTNHTKIVDENVKSKCGSGNNSINQSISSEGDSGNSDMAKTALEVASELILQPHQAPVSSGGGGGNDSGDWGDEDKKKRRSGRKR